MDNFCRENQIPNDPELLHDQLRFPSDQNNVKSIPWVRPPRLPDSLYLSVSLFLSFARSAGARALSRSLWLFLSLSLSHARARYILLASFLHFPLRQTASRSEAPAHAGSCEFGKIMCFVYVCRTSTRLPHLPLQHHFSLLHSSCYNLFKTRSTALLEAC